MFLKTQKDLDELLQEYPISSYSISVSGWKYGLRESLVIFDVFSISSKNNNIILTGYSDDKYEYTKKWIQVINIFKKTKQSEWLARAIPIMLNEKWIVEPDLTNDKRKEKILVIQQFYDDIEKFFHMYNYIQSELRLLTKQIQYDDVLNNQAILNNNSDLRIFRFYYQQSLSDYFALWYRKLIDNDSSNQKNFNFRMILQKWGDMGLIKKDKIDYISKEFELYQNSENIIVKHVNKLVAHMDKDKFNEYFKIRRISATWIEFTKSTTNPEKIIEELDKLILFIDKTVNENFSPQIRFWHWWWHSEKQFTLKIIQKN